MPETSQRSPQSQVYRHIFFLFYFFKTDFWDLFVSFIIPFFVAINDPSYNFITVFCAFHLNVGYLVYAKSVTIAYNYAPKSFERTWQKNIDRDPAYYLRNANDYHLVHLGQNYLKNLHSTHFQLPGMRSIPKSNSKTIKPPSNGHFVPI